MNQPRTVTLTDALRWGVSKGWVVYPVKVNYCVATYIHRNGPKRVRNLPKPQPSQ